MARRAIYTHVAPFSGCRGNLAAPRLGHHPSLREEPTKQFHDELNVVIGLVSFQLKWEETDAREAELTEQLTERVENASFG